VLRSFYSEYMQNHKNRCINSPSSFIITIFCHFSVIFTFLSQKIICFWAFNRFLTIKYNYRHFGVVSCRSFAVITTIIVVFSDFFTKNTKKAANLQVFSSKKRKKLIICLFAPLIHHIYLIFLYYNHRIYIFTSRICSFVLKNTAINLMIFPYLMSVSPNNLWKKMNLHSI
jgi:hypothetical protein